MIRYLKSAPAPSLFTVNLICVIWKVNVLSTHFSIHLNRRSQNDELTLLFYKYLSLVALSFLSLPFLYSCLPFRTWSAACLRSLTALSISSLVVLLPTLRRRALTASSQDTPDASKISEDKKLQVKHKKVEITGHFAKLCTNTVKHPNTN